MKHILMIIVLLAGFIIGLFATYEDRNYRLLEWDWHYKSGLNEKEITETCLIKWDKTGHSGRYLFCITNGK